MLHRLGIDVACRAAHQVSLADERGRFLCVPPPLKRMGENTEARRAPPATSEWMWPTSVSPEGITVDSVIGQL